MFFAGVAPRIHVDDCADAYVKAVERLPVGERLIIADDTSCTVREFSDYMAECMGVPRPRSIPGFLVRIVGGTSLSNDRDEGEQRQGPRGLVKWSVTG